MLKIFILMTAAAALLAQNPAIKRTVIQRNEFSVPGREAVVAQVEIVPGGFAGMHTHAGEEIGYVTEGELELLIDGQPARTIKTGESFMVPAGARHNGHNKGTGQLKFVGVYLIDKGTPLATPAP